VLQDVVLGQWIVRALDRPQRRMP